DWGARTADIMAVLWAEGCRGIVSVSGYLIGGQGAGEDPPPPGAGVGRGVQELFCDRRGPVGYDKYRRDLTTMVWPARFPQWEVRRRKVRKKRGGVRQPRSRCCRRAQLPLAARPGRR